MGKRGVEANLALATIIPFPRPLHILFSLTRPPIKGVLQANRQKRIGP